MSLRSLETRPEVGMGPAKSAWAGLRSLRGDAWSVRTRRGVKRASTRLGRREQPTLASLLTDVAEDQALAAEMTAVQVPEEPEPALEPEMELQLQALGSEALWDFLRTAQSLPVLPSQEREPLTESEDWEAFGLQLLESGPQLLSPAALGQTLGWEKQDFGRPEWTEPGGKLGAWSPPSYVNGLDPFERATLLGLAPCSTERVF